MHLLSATSATIPYSSSKPVGLGRGPFGTVPSQQTVLSLGLSLFSNPHLPPQLTVVTPVTYLGMS